MRTTTRTISLSLIATTLLAGCTQATTDTNVTKPSANVSTPTTAFTSFATTLSTLTGPDGYDSANPGDAQLEGGPYAGQWNAIADGTWQTSIDGVHRALRLWQKNVNKSSVEVTCATLEKWINTIAEELKLDKSRNGQPQSCNDTLKETQKAGTNTTWLTVQARGGAQSDGKNHYTISGLAINSPQGEGVLVRAVAEAVSPLDDTSSTPTP